MAALMNTLSRSLFSCDRKSNCTSNPVNWLLKVSLTTFSLMGFAVVPSPFESRILSKVLPSAYAETQTPIKNNIPKQSMPIIAVARTAPTHSTVPDGIYLYGQSPEPDQIGQEYLVFESKQGIIRGASYLPRSEFVCFDASHQDQILTVTLRESQGPIIVTHNQSAPSRQYLASASTRGSVSGPSITSSDAATSPSYPINLNTFHRIQDVSQNDQRILTACLTSSP